jgi:hypothetical protein
MIECKFVLLFVCCCTIDSNTDLSAFILVSSVARHSFPGYLSSEAPLLPSYPNLGSTNVLGASSNFLQKDVSN